MNLQQNIKYTDTGYYRKVPILLQRLNANGFKFPNVSNFKETIMKVFDINIDTAQFDDISYMDNLFIIFKKEKFISFDVREDYFSKNVSRNENMFLQLNNYIFNNSMEAKQILLEKKPESFKQLILSTGYPILNDSDVANEYLKNPEIIFFKKNEWPFLLFFHKSEIILGIKENLARFVAKQYPNAFINSTYNILYPEPTDEDIYGYRFTNNNVKFKCWGQIVDIGWHIHDISYFVQVFETHKDLSGFYKTHNYYGLKGLERFCKLYDKYGVEDPNKFQPQDAFWEDAPYNFEN